MSRIRTVTLAVGGLWLGVALCTAADSRSCAELEGAAPQGHVEYLLRDRSALTPACVAYAADQIGLRKYGPAAKTLVKLLDYRLPDDPATARFAGISRIPTLGRIYPVTDALCEIGKAAVPALLDAVASAAISDVARVNAIHVLALIHRADVTEGIRVLIRASKSASDRQASIRLYDAARAIAGMCREPERNSCMNALQ